MFGPAAGERGDRPIGRTGYCGGVLEDVLPWLACPHCGGHLRVSGASLICSSGHTSNVARQGYVSLLGRDAGTHTADSAEMIAARERVFADGLFAPLVEAVSDLAFESGSEAGDGPVLDLGSGPGSYLQAVLDRLPDRPGIALDNSKFAARRAARAHPRIGAVVADIWDRFPVRTDAVSLLINVFSPRNGEEMARVVAPGGRTIVVVPEADHLGELIDRFGMISVDPDKQERVDQSLQALGRPLRSSSMDWAISADPGQVKDLVGMGPSAGRLAPEAMAEAVAGLPDRSAVTGSVCIHLF